MSSSWSNIRGHTTANTSLSTASSSHSSRHVIVALRRHDVSNANSYWTHIWPLTARFMGPKWGDRAQVDPMLATWTLLSGTWNWRRGASTHRQLDCLSEALLTKYKTIKSRLHYWPFVRGIHQWRRIPFTKSQQWKYFHVITLKWQLLVQPVKKNSSNDKIFVSITMTS